MIAQIKREDMSDRKAISHPPRQRDVHQPLSHHLCHIRVIFGIIIHNLADQK